MTKGLKVVVCIIIGVRVCVCVCLDRVRRSFFFSFFIFSIRGSLAIPLEDCAPDFAFICALARVSLYSICVSLSLSLCIAHRRILIYG